MVKNPGLLIWVGLCTAGWVFAQEPIAIMGTQVQTIQLTIPKPQDKDFLIQGSRPYVQRVSVLKLHLSKETKKNLARRIRNLVRPPRMRGIVAPSPRSVQLGMNAVPVLNQGEHGTCMTFASTAALDAAIGKGDYVSQLCQLDLNQYLHHYAFVPGGWEGAWGQEILMQMTMFGIVPKLVQYAGGCAGRVNYPLYGEDIPDELSVLSYHQISESLLDYGVSFYPLILREQINAQFIDLDDIFNQIKKSLSQGDRVISSIILLGSNRNDDTPTASHLVSKDTWVLLPQMAEELAIEEESYGHAFVVTGYDDDAIAIDAAGQSHHGLLTLRNSWGSKVGDHGNFYMSYAYFKATLLEAYQVKRSFGLTQNPNYSPVTDIMHK